MKIGIRFDDSESDQYDEKDYELNGDELLSFLSCNGIGYNGSYYRIKSKIFEDTKEGNSLTVIAIKDFDVTV